MKTDRQTARQTARQTDRQTDRQTERQRCLFLASHMYNVYTIHSKKYIYISNTFMDMATREAQIKSFK